MGRMYASARDRVFAARYLRRVEQKFYSAVDARVIVLGNSSMRMIFFLRSSGFCSEAIAGAGSSSEKISSCPNLPPRPMNSSNSAAIDTNPSSNAIEPAGFRHSSISAPIDFARSYTVVVFPILAAPLRINSLCRS